MLVKNLFVILMITLGLSACNTVNGIGKDLENAGKAVQKTSKGEN